MTSRNPEFSGSPASSRIEKALEEYRQHQEELLAEKLAQKELEFRENMERLEEMERNTFEIVRKEGEDKRARADSFEKDLRRSFEVIRTSLQEKFLSPPQVESVIRKIVPRVLGRETYTQEKGGGSS